jgi:hypothetical protein
MRAFISSSLSIAVVLALGTTAALACDQGTSYCSNNYVYTCECWTGQGCKWAYSGYSANCAGYQISDKRQTNPQPPNK